MNPNDATADQEGRYRISVAPAAVERNMRKQASLVVLVAALPLLAACGQPVPEDKAAYVGEWHAPAMDVELTKDGIVHYKRVTDGTAIGEVTTTINAPLRRFEGDNFVIGIPLLSTTFEVSTPPHQEAGAWKMVVDGVELTRAP